MIVALILLSALVVTGTLLYYLDKRSAGTQPGEAETDDRPQPADDGCCGMHITCEKDSLLAAVSPEIIYYDDEELDAYAGTGADDYSEEAIEEFRNVLLTLLPEDIAGWGRSIQLRGITLPTPVRDELMMIVSEARAASTATVHNG
jgi:hypothetical protein